MARMCDAIAVDRPVFVKIDAQWAEMEVLNGMGDILDEVEAGVVEIQKDTKDAVVEFLTRNGFLWTDLGADIGFRREGC
jgi:hypothetical protein